MHERRVARAERAEQQARRLEQVHASFYLTRTLPAMGVLRLREFRLLFGAQAVSMLGRPDGGHRARVRGARAGRVGDRGRHRARRAGSLPLVATLLIGGVVADRVSRRAVMVVADLARLLTQGAIAALLIAGAAEIWMLAVLVRR